MYIYIYIIFKEVNKESTMTYLKPHSKPVAGPELEFEPVHML